MKRRLPIESIALRDTKYAKLTARPPHLFRCFLVGLLQGVLVPLYAFLLLQALVHLIHGPVLIRVGWLVTGGILTVMLPFISQVALHWALGVNPRLYGLGSRQGLSVLISLFSGTLLMMMLIAVGVVWLYPGA